jgi:hypothetical protein
MRPRRPSIRRRAGPQPPHGTIRIFKATHSGALRNLEIMSYRESHGGEIRNPAWRAQFDHRDSLGHLQFRTDIKNISGATLSSEHVTQGVRWLLALWQATLRPTTGAT